MPPPKYKLTQSEYLTVISAGPQAYNKKFENGTDFDLIQRDRKFIILTSISTQETIYISIERFGQFFEAAMFVREEQ